LAIRVQYLMHDITTFIEASKTASAGAMKMYAVENEKYATAGCADDFSVHVVQFIMTQEIEGLLRELGFIKVKRFVL